MKRIVLLLLLMLPLIASAQFYISPRLGISYNKFKRSNANISYFANPEFGYDMKSLSIGLGLRFTNVKDRFDEEVNSPAINPYIFIGKKFTINTNSIGVYVNFGIIQHQSEGIYKKMNSNYGFTYGVSVNYLVPIRNNIDFLIGTQPTYCVLVNKNKNGALYDQKYIDNGSGNVITVPLYVGVSFKF